ncbi:MAG TPA: hypothetical protein VMI32_13685 [Candidatus Solibacter sp.]|nr:hypothetical protein [Candidatus Solibacter sp.]
MRHHLPGLYSSQVANGRLLEGLFLVRVDRAFFRWQPKKPYLELRLAILEPKARENLSFYGRLYCTEKALWKLNWFLRDFAYDSELLRLDQIDVKALLNLQGVVRTSHSVVNGRAYQNLDAFASASEWETLSCSAPTVSGEKAGEP